MSLFTGIIEFLLNTFSDLSGRNIWVFPDANGRRLFDFERRSHGCQTEYFGLGLHFLVSLEVRSKPSPVKIKQKPRSI